MTNINKEETYFTNKTFHEFHSKLAWHLSDVFSNDLKTTYTFKKIRCINDQKVIQSLSSTLFSHIYSIPFFCSLGAGYIVVDQSICINFSQQLMGNPSKENYTPSPILLEFMAHQLTQNIANFDHEPISKMLNLDNAIHIETDIKTHHLHGDYIVFQLQLLNVKNPIGYLYFIWPYSEISHKTGGAL